MRLKRVLGAVRKAIACPAVTLTVDLTPWMPAAAPITLVWPGVGDPRLAEAQPAADQLLAEQPGLGPEIAWVIALLATTHTDPPAELPERVSFYLRMLKEHPDALEHVCREVWEGARLDRRPHRGRPNR